MENPVREVPGVIAALTQGNSDDQARVLEDYFLPDAYFVHPFCRVPSFRDFALPFPVPFFTGSPSRRTVNSRRLVLMIYEWYRILSPKIVFTIDSVGMFILVFFSRFIIIIIFFLFCLVTSHTLYSSS